MVYVTMGKKPHAPMIAHHPHLIVVMVSATMAKKPHALMIVLLDVLLNIFLMEMADAFTIALDYRGHPGMTFNNVVFVHLNTWTMETVNVFIIMFTMVVVVQWVLYYRELVAYALKDSGIIWATVH